MNLIFQTRRKAVKPTDILRDLENSPEYTLLVTDEETEENHISKIDKCGDILKTQTPLSKWHHFSIWLNCIINEANIKYYLLGNIFIAFGLFSGINLSVASICSNFEIWHIFRGKILVPYSCCGIFDHFQ